MLEKILVYHDYIETHVNIKSTNKYNGIGQQCLQTWQRNDKNMTIPDWNRDMVLWLLLILQIVFTERCRRTNRCLETKMAAKKKKVVGLPRK